MSIFWKYNVVIFVRSFILDIKDDKSNKITLQQTINDREKLV